MYKKLISLLLVFILVLSFPCVANAEDTGYSQSSTITYTVEGSYMIYIPMEISVGEDVTIQASEVNILDDKMITVSFENLEANGGITLTNQDSGDTICVFFYNNNGEMYTGQNRLIGTFDNSSQNTYYTFTSTAIYDSSQKAGCYTGTVSFYIGCVDKE